jgi:acetyl esterase/lipase/lysophospholipase L1-like esterase
MKSKITALLLLIVSIGNAQKVIPLYTGKATGSESWIWNEKEMFSDMIQTQVVYNVSEPTLTLYAPPAASANGTVVIIAPGGGFHFLSINSEGVDVAKWLNAKGITAFVLKYRLVKIETDDPVKEAFGGMNDRKKFDEENEKLIPLAIRDGSEAIKFVRSHAVEYGLNPKRIGIMGFSAGGTVTTGSLLNYSAESRPDFAAPIYPYMGVFKDLVVPQDAPPIFIAAASDDQLGLAPHSIELYSKWIDAGKSAELHMYLKGGHGFGMRKQNLPTDMWIDRFGDWLEVQGLLMPSNPNHWMNKLTPEQVIKNKRESEERTKNDWANLKRFEDENKKLSPPKAGENRVVFMGNSITEGWKRMDTSFFSSKPYINRGISGQTTPQMLLRFRQDVIDLNPKVVVILAGINDIAQNTGPTTLEAIMGNLASMATLAKANGIKVILSSVLPAYDFPWRPGLQPAEKVVALNKMIKSYAEKNGHIYLDYFSSMVDERKGMKKGLASDEIHPTAAGYSMMKPMAEKAIAEALKSK